MPVLGVELASAKNVNIWICALAHDRDRIYNLTWTNTVETLQYSHFQNEICHKNRNLTWTKTGNTLSLMSSCHHIVHLSMRSDLRFCRCFSCFGHSWRVLWLKSGRRCVSRGAMAASLERVLWCAMPNVHGRLGDDAGRGFVPAFARSLG